jgi:chemotaxis methyl-accepting protein methylase
MSDHEDPGLVALAERIAGRSGLDMAAYKDRCIRRRIAARMRACGVHSYGEYLQVLDLRPGELDLLLDALTINVTKFFRNRETWEWLGRHILPDLFQARPGPIRAWSAGCASGEEAYTLVMLTVLVLERLGRPDWLARLHVDATDIDRESLRRATTGHYDARTFSEADPLVAERFCRAVAGGGLEVLPALRSLVTVSRMDLTSEPPPTGA